MVTHKGHAEARSTGRTSSLSFRRAKFDKRMLIERASREDQDAAE